MRIKIFIITIPLFLSLFSGCASKKKEKEVPKHEIHERDRITNDENPDNEILFSYYIPDLIDSSVPPVALLIHAKNYSDYSFIDKEWIEFAKKNNFVIIDVNLVISESSWRLDKKYKNYIFQDQWIRKSLLEIIDKVNNVKKVKTNDLYLYGSSLGGDVALNFSFWNEGKCKAVSVFNLHLFERSNRWNSAQVFINYWENQDMYYPEHVRLFRENLKSLEVSAIIETFKFTDDQTIEKHKKLSRSLFEQVFQNKVDIVLDYE